MRPIFRLALPLVFFAATVVLATPAVAATSLLVTPDTGLVQGQLVDVVGTGFTPSASVVWCEGVRTAAPSLNDCATTFQTSTTDASGAFAGSLQVQRRFFSVSLGVPVDCANPSNPCWIGAAEVPNPVGTIAFAPLQFAPVPSVVPNVGTVTEGNSGSQTLTVPVSLSVPTTTTVTVDWTTFFIPGRNDNQAAPPGDYVSASGTVVFTPGQTSQSVEVTINGDTTVEPDEYLVLSFRNPTNAVMGGFWGLAVGIIQNDD